MDTYIVRNRIIGEIEVVIDTEKNLVNEIRLKPKGSGKEYDLPEKFAELQKFLEDNTLTEKYEGSLDIFDFSNVTDFRRKVYDKLLQMPKGSTKSYKELAADSGSPKASRAIGSAMANNPFPIVFPCHRILTSDKRLGGFGGGTDMKAAMLKAEGAQFKA